MPSSAAASMIAASRPGRVVAHTRESYAAWTHAKIASAFASSAAERTAAAFDASPCVHVIDPMVLAGTARASAGGAERVMTRASVPAAARSRAIWAPI